VLRKSGGVLVKSGGVLVKSGGVLTCIPSYSTHHPWVKQNNIT
jgi:hypothetical protein